jgi:hypothetical protein
MPDQIESLRQALKEVAKMLVTTNELLALAITGINEWAPSEQKQAADDLLAAVLAKARQSSKKGE